MSDSSTSRAFVRRILLVASLLAPASLPAAATPPNVIVITSDDHSAPTSRPSARTR